MTKKKTTPTGIHPSLWDSFMPLPSDPSVPLTEEQIKAVFPHPEVWREMIELTMKLHHVEPIEPDGD